MVMRDGLSRRLSGWLYFLEFVWGVSPDLKAAMNKEAVSVRCVRCRSRVWQTRNCLPSFLGSGGVQGGGAWDEDP